MKVKENEEIPTFGSAEGFIGGILKNLDALTHFLAPSNNSLRRI
jgi:glutamine synthetase